MDHAGVVRAAGPSCRLPARLSGEGRTVGNGLRMQTERLTRSVRRVAGRYGPVARATLVCNRSIMPALERPCPSVFALKISLRGAGYLADTRRVHRPNTTGTDWRGGENQPMPCRFSLI